MAAGLGVFRLSSRDFWALTPREFEAIAQALAGDPVTAPDRAGLDQLMSRFPDVEPSS
jgi:uncharacterized phage protein (TIGR02216 family)